MVGPLRGGPMTERPESEPLWRHLTPRDITKVRKALRANQAQRALSHYGLTLEQARRLRDPKTCGCGRLVGVLPRREDPDSCMSCQG